MRVPKVGSQVACSPWWLRCSRMATWRKAEAAVHRDGPQARRESKARIPHHSLRRAAVKDCQILQRCFVWSHATYRCYVLLAKGLETERSSLYPKRRIKSHLSTPMTVHTHSVCDACIRVRFTAIAMVMAARRVSRTTSGWGSRRGSWSCSQRRARGRS